MGLDQADLDDLPVASDSGGGVAASDVELAAGRDLDVAWRVTVHANAAHSSRLRAGCQAFAAPGQNGVAEARQRPWPLLLLDLRRDAVDATGSAKRNESAAWS